MAVNLLDETTLTLLDAAKALPPLWNGKRVHVATLYRWMTYGVRGVRLESQYVGRTRVTSLEASLPSPCSCPTMSSLASRRSRSSGRASGRARSRGCTGGHRWGRTRWTPGGP